MSEIYSNDMLKILKQREQAKESYNRRKDEIKRKYHEKKSLMDNESKPIKVVSEEEIQRRKEHRKLYQRAYQKPYQREYIKELRNQIYETIPIEGRIMTGVRGRPVFRKLRALQNDTCNITL